MTSSFGVKGDGVTATAAATVPEPNAVVLGYLRKMGYRQTERMFRDEAHISGGPEVLAFEMANETDSSISNYLLFGPNVAQADGSVYGLAYEGLRQWIYQSLDDFREELQSILYPVFIHSFLELLLKGNGGGGDALHYFEKYREDHSARHSDDLIIFQSLRDAGQVRENPLSAAFCTNKYNISMSAFSFQMLMSFLQEASSVSSPEGQSNILILKIINQHVNIRVLLSSSKSPHEASLYAAVAKGVTGVPVSSAIAMNSAEIKWGVYAIEPSIEAALVQRAKSESRLNEILQGPLIQLKRQYAHSTPKAPVSESAVVSGEGADCLVVSLAAETNAEIDRLRNLSRRAILSSTILPSICCYTIHNSNDGITCTDFSLNSTLLATGNKDSFIDIWSLTNDPLKSIKPSTELATVELGDLDSLESMKEFEGSLTKRLIGHSGPVYSCKFMPPDAQRLLLSASQDGTVRLWSLDIFSCLAVYRGHNLPIWDLDVAPPGCKPYFVTAGADRTARLWSTTNIQVLRIFVGHLSDVDVVKFHPNGNYILTGSSDKTCRLWDVQSGKCVRLFAGHLRGISAIAISPDGKIIASGDRSGIVKVWDIAEGKLLCTFWAATPANSNDPLQKSKYNSSNANSSIYSIDFDRDGRILATSGADQTVKLWEVSKLIHCAGATNNNIVPLSTYHTKSTPITRLQFTFRNILLAAGPYRPT